MVQEETARKPPWIIQCFFCWSPFFSHKGIACKIISKIITVSTPLVRRLLFQPPKNGGISRLEKPSSLTNESDKTWQTLGLCRISSSGRSTYEALSKQWLNVSRKKPRAGLMNIYCPPLNSISQTWISWDLSFATSAPQTLRLTNYTVSKLLGNQVDQCFPQASS